MNNPFYMESFCYLAYLLFPVISPSERGCPISCPDSQEGFTLVELLVSMAIIGVLAATLLSVLGMVQSNANRTVCVSNLHALAIGVISYTGEHNGMFPSTAGDDNAITWDGEIMPYMVAADRKSAGPTKVLKCPEDKRPLIIDAKKQYYPRSYRLSSQEANNPTSLMGIVGYTTDASGNTVNVPRLLSLVVAPSQTIMIWESFTGDSMTPDYISNYQFHSGLSVGSGWKSTSRNAGYRPDGSKKFYHDPNLNYAMVDGHVETHDTKWACTAPSHWDAIR